MMKAVILAAAAASASAFAPAAVLPRAAKSECPAICASSLNRFVMVECIELSEVERSESREGREKGNSQHFSLRSVWIQRSLAAGRAK